MSSASQGIFVCFERCVTCSGKHRSIDSMNNKCEYAFMVEVTKAPKMLRSLARLRFHDGFYKFVPHGFFVSRNNQAESTGMRFYNKEELFGTR